jgi:drug/metabolite transporter (DMT)-like permease
MYMVETKKIMIRGVLCTLLGGTLWGFSGTCSQLLLTVYDVPVIYVTWVRMLASGLMLLTLMCVRDRKKLLDMVRDRATIGGLLLYSVLGLFVGQVGYAMCIEYTDAGTATVLQSFGTVVLIAYTCIRQRKAPRKVEAIATVMALTAVFLIATQGNPAVLVVPAAGLAWGLLNGFSSAFFAGYPRKLLARWGSLPVMGLAMLAGGVYTFPFAQPWNVSVHWDLLSVGALLSIIVLGTFVSFTLFLQGVKDLGGVKASLLGVVEPVSATFFSWALMGSRFTVMDLFGFALMIGMVVLVTAVRPKEEASESCDPAEDSCEPAVDSDRELVPIPASPNDSREAA